MNKLLIGAIHFPPMPGYEDYPGFDIALENALADLKAFEEGGMNAVVIENNYDIPHKEKISKDVFDEMVQLGLEVKKNTDLSVGVSVLWNDYESALKIAQKIGGDFVRVPVFVDKVKTSYGIMEPKADDVIKFRENIKAEDIKIYADIHVKHSEILSRNTIEESAKQAVKKGADAVIVTGQWTGDSPDIVDLEKVRKAVGDFPIICGSGVDKSNISRLFEITDGAIISTYLKKDTDDLHNENVKSYSARVSLDKVRDLVSRLNY